jgi:hypothetical protein
VSWWQDFMARHIVADDPNEERTMLDDELHTGAGGGEELHPDQDNAPILATQPGADFAATASSEGKIIALTGADFRTAVGAVYPGDVRARAVADLFAAALEGGQIAEHGPQLTPYQQQVIDHLISYLSRS